MKTRTTVLFPPLSSNYLVTFTQCGLKNQEARILSSTPPQHGIQNVFVLEHGDAKCLVDLQSELKILIHVGEHENIVNILGACTTGLQHASIVFKTYRDCVNL